MLNRRGSLNGTIQGDALLGYKPGDIVKPVIVTDMFFTGVVVDVDEKTNKILVSWGNGPVSQHDVDEIMPVSPIVLSAKDTRRIKSSDTVEDLTDKVVTASNTAFESELKSEIDKKIKELKREGTVSMSVENLMQVVRPPSSSLDGAPKGTNAKYYYAQMFKDLCKGMPFCKIASESRIATGEMSRFDILPGGEDYEWAKDIERAAREIQRLSKGKVRFIEMRPFDKYQGPYARMNAGKVWGGSKNGTFVYEGNETIEGTTGEIALALLTGIAASGLRSRRAMYWCAPDRTFRLTRQEQDSGSALCPKCRCEMNKEKFTKTDKLLVCVSCGFKVPTSKAVKNVEVKVPEGVNVKVTQTDDTGDEVCGENIIGSRRGRMAFLEDVDLTNSHRCTYTRSPS